MVWRDEEFRLVRTRKGDGVKIVGNLEGLGPIVSRKRRQKENNSLPLESKEAILVPLANLG